jgi:hypothetical protein
MPNSRTTKNQAVFKVKSEISIQTIPISEYLQRLRYALIFGKSRCVDVGNNFEAQKNRN